MVWDGGALEKTPVLRSILITVLVIMACLAFVLAAGNRSLNSDLYLGLASGKMTLTGHIAQPDHWSFTASDRVWIDQSWLSNVFYYLSYRSLGFIGPVALKVALLLGCVIILFYRCRRLGASTGLTLLALWPALITVSPGLALKYCARLFNSAGIRRAPVFDGKEIIGILSNTDIFNAIEV